MATGDGGFIQRAKPETVKSTNEIAVELTNRLDRMRLNEESFQANIAGYLSNDIKNDLKRVNEKGGKYNSFSDRDIEQEYIAHGFEAAIIILAKDQNWLGKDSEVIAPTIFDDTFNGADMIILEKNKKEGASVGMTFDLTISSEDGSIFGKVSRNLENAVTNVFSHPKYVLENTPVDQQPKLPVGIFACSDENARKLIDAVGKNDEESLKVQGEFRAFLGHQMKMFLNTAIEICKDLSNATNSSVKRNAFASLKILEKDLAFFAEKFIYDEVPSELLSDRSYNNFEQTLRQQKIEITKNLLSKEFSPYDKFEQPKRPRIPRKV